MLSNPIFFFFFAIQYTYESIKKPGNFQFIYANSWENGKRAQMDPMFTQKKFRGFIRLGRLFFVIIFRRNVYITRGKFSLSVDFFVR